VIVIKGCRLSKPISKAEERSYPSGVRPQTYTGDKLNSVTKIVGIGRGLKRFYPLLFSIGLCPGKRGCLPIQHLFEKRGLTSAVKLFRLYVIY
jgi:hypothetical protein